MATELIVCPRCGASPSSAPDAQGQYTCVYCGSRFRTQTQFAARPVHVSPPAHAPVARPVAAKKSSGAATALAVIGGLVLLCAAGGVLAVFQNHAEHGGNGSAPATPAATATTGDVPASAADPGAAEPAASATFEAQSRASGYQSSFYVLGFVKNTSPFTIEKPKVTVVLRDANGKELATRDGYAEGEVLLPQASAPVKVLVSDPPKYGRMTFEVVARKASYLPEASSGLRLEILEAPHSTGGSSWEVTGKVFNDGKLPSRFVSILALAFDAKDQLIGLDSTFVDGEAIAPAASARFRAMPLYDTPPHHFKYVVAGRVER